MKRRTFIKRTSIGLSAIVAGAAVAGAGGLRPPGDDKRRVYGIPGSVQPRTPLEHNRTRLSLSRTDLPVEAWQDVVALSLLAQDVFDRPEVARSFTRNPAGYLKAAGMGDVTLDPEAVEVKVALALGDPEIRDALLRDDPQAFVGALEARGLLQSPEPSQLAQRLSSQMDAIKATLEDGPSPKSCTVFAICVAAVWIWVVAVQDAVVVVNAGAFVNIYALVMIYTRTIGPKHPKPDPAEALGDLPPFQLATAMGGRSFGGKVADTFIDGNVNRIASAVESLEAYRETAPMNPTQLRALVRGQMIRQLQGHTVSLEASQP